MPTYVPPTAAEYVRGAVWPCSRQPLVGAYVAARLGLKTSLTAWDITALRFGVAGPGVLPFLPKRGLAFDRLGWTGLSAILAGDRRQNGELGMNGAGVGLAAGGLPGAGAAPAQPAGAPPVRLRAGVVRAHCSQAMPPARMSATMAGIAREGRSAGCSTATIS
jgi:hypothetical protein